jgi:hypothetical protein
LRDVFSGDCDGGDRDSTESEEGESGTHDV